ncbi:MAG: NAD+ synthase [Actinobacteria bacterium]|nr:MAG: NAD+ synthase [Actinomycetota bacterium]
MTRSFRVAGAQLDLIVGDLDGNESKITHAMEWAEENEADVLVLPELAIPGYPPEDLVLRQGFVEENLAVLDRLAEASGSTATVVGFLDRLEKSQKDDDAVSRTVTNAAAVIADGRIKGVYHKTLLPTYGVFDERRYFAEGRTPLTLHDIGGAACGISICEDIWDNDGPPTGQAVGGAEVLLNMNGSPYHIGKSVERLEMLTERAIMGAAYVVYVNAVGGQDELVFDGASMVIDPNGNLVHRSPQFVEDRFIVDISLEGHVSALLPVVRVTDRRSARSPAATPTVAAPLDDIEEVYEALCAGLHGYVTKNGFSEVVIGLSGGIDSALTAAIAADSLGPDAVHGITMPTRYSSAGSVDDSYDLADRLGIRIDTIPIEDLFGGFLEALDPLFVDTPINVAEENLQARIRGTILMAVSNKFGGMVVATGNKSEMAVGYATLYGDMAGGYAVLKDVYKTMVYDLARWRNGRGNVIPQSTIDKEPSAELRDDQRDTDSLPPYPLLDEILHRYIELDMAADEIVAAGFDNSLTHIIATMVDRNEYKRRQAPPGVRITQKAFGRDRRLPITNWFKP